MGPAKSFLDLVYNAPLKYDYYAFCDQDDYWKEDKLYKAIERLEHFDDKPALYHCELEIVDENLEHMKKEMLSKYKTFASYPKSIKAKNYFFKQSTENVFSTRELQKAKLRILFGSL